MSQAKCDSNPETAAVRLDAVAIHMTTAPPAFPELVKQIKTGWLSAMAQAMDADRWCQW